MAIPFFLNECEINLLKKFGLTTPQDLLDYYRRKKEPELYELFIKTLGAMTLAPS